MDKNWAKKKKLNNTNRHNNIPRSPDWSEKSMEPMTEKEAEHRIQNCLLLRSWRHQREKSSQLEIEVKGLTNQVDSLQLQIYALRQLLDAEKTRVVHVNNDLRKILNALEECKHEKRLLIKEKEQLEVRLQVMDEKLMGMENECKNQKNELLTARSEAQNWEKQLEKEREKLSKMKDERKFLIEEDIQELGEESKETANTGNPRKTTRDSRVKSTSCKSGKKNSGRGREDRGVGKVDFGKNGKLKKPFFCCKGGKLTEFKCPVD